MTTYATLKKSLRPDRRIWAAIQNVRTAQEAGEPQAEHVDALSRLYDGFLSQLRGTGALEEAARVLEASGRGGLWSVNFPHRFSHNV